MSDLKKIRKKLLKSVLGTTLLAVGLVSIQSISAMSSNKKGLGKIFLLNVMQKIRDKETLIKYAQINKKCLDTLKITHINPIPVTKENAKELFPQLQTLCLYDSKTNVDEIKDKKIIFDYSFGIGELIHYVSFFNGYDKKYSDDLLNRLNELKKELQPSDEQLSIELKNLLSNLPIIYEREYKYLKNFINCMAPDFEESKEFKHEHSRYEERVTTTAMEDEDTMEDTVEITEIKAMEGIKYTYKIIETKSKIKKALVYIMVNEGSQLTKGHLMHIIEELKEQGVEINIKNIVSGKTDCKNVIFTIRPEKEQKFKISTDSFFKFCNLTVNIVRAEAGYHAFHECSDSVINIYDSYFVNEKEHAFGGSVNTCDNLTLNVHRTNLDYGSLVFSRGNTTLNIYDDSQLRRYAIMQCTTPFASRIPTKITLNIYGDAKLDNDALLSCSNLTLNNYSNVQFDENDIKKSSHGVVVVNNIKKK